MVWEPLEFEKKFKKFIFQNSKNNTNFAILTKVFIIGYVHFIAPPGPPKIPSLFKSLLWF